MTTLSYTIPVAGSTLNSIADPEIATALQAIQTWGNGNIDPTNLKSVISAGVLASRPAAASVANTFYYGTDSGLLYWSTGTAWNTVPTTPPAFAQPARAYRNNAVTLNSVADTKIPVDTVSFDPGSFFDATTNHRYNVSTTGYYSVSAQVDLASVETGNTPYLSLYKTGVKVSVGSTETVSASASARSVVTDIISCTAGDYLELFAWVGGSGVATLNVVGSKSNFMTVTRVG